MRVHSKKKLLSLLAATMVLGVGLVGCSGAGNDGNADSTAKTENVYKEKYNPEVTISTVWG